MQLIIESQPDENIDYNAMMHINYYDIIMMTT